MILLALRFNCINKSRNFNEFVTYLVSRQVCTSCLNQLCKPVLFSPQWVVTKDGATVAIEMVIVIYIAYTNINNINPISISCVYIFITFPFKQELPKVSYAVHTLTYCNCYHCK